MTVWVRETNGKQSQGLQHCGNQSQDSQMRCSCSAEKGEKAGQKPLGEMKKISTINELSCSWPKQHSLHFSPRDRTQYWQL